MKLISNTYFYTLLFSLFFVFANAQRNSDKADRYFNQNQFESAIKYYQLDVNSGNKKAKEYAMAKLADCYRIIGEFEKAEETYRKILKRKNKEPKNYLNYGLSLKSSAKYAEAKLQFEEYIKLKPDDPMGPVYLQSCDSAQKWLDETIGKEIKNIEQINTSFSEFGTYVYQNQLYFSSSRPGSKQAFISFDGGGDVHRMDVYEVDLVDLLNKTISEKQIKNVSPVNSPMHEGVPTFTKDGSEMYFTKTVKGSRNQKTNNILNTLQIFYSKKDSTGNWIKPISAFTFNSSDYSVAHPALTNDGKRMYFMSDMPGGLGKTDIYFSDKNADGTWSKPKNVGNKVNTFGYELFPVIAPNGDLYFSSNAHPGMGQLDVFCAKFIDGKWDNVQNMKPPINSIGNDFGVSFDQSGYRGFVSSDRFNGKGSEDIYSFSSDAVIDVMIVNDTVWVKNNFVFDDVKFKFSNLTDSSDVETNIEDASHKLVLSDAKNYIIIAKKNGMPYGKIEISKSGDLFLVNPSDVSVLLSGKFESTVKAIKITSNSGYDKRVELNSESIFIENQVLKANDNFKLQLEK